MGMDKLPDAPVVSGGGSSAASGDPGIVFTYGVMLTDGTILPFVNNLSDFAGLPGRTITGIAIKVNKGTVKYLSLIHIWDHRHRLADRPIRHVI